MSWYPGQPKSETMVQSLPKANAPPSPIPFTPQNIHRFGELADEGWYPVDMARSNKPISPINVHIERDQVDLELHRTGAKDLTPGREFRFVQNQTYDQQLASIYAKFKSLLRFPVERIYAESRVSEAENWDSSRSVTSKRLRGYRVYFLTAPGYEECCVYDTDDVEEDAGSSAAAAPERNFRMSIIEEETSPTRISFRINVAP